jgi:hypothetical protein
LNITVNVDDVTLASVVGEVTSYDEEGNREYNGEATTIADLVVRRIVRKATQGPDWDSLARRITTVRDEVIRELVRPQVEEALTAPVQRTSSWGDPVGDPQTLRDVIIAEAQKLLKQPADSYNRDKGTVLEQVVRKEVQAALSAEIKAAVQQAREAVAGEIGQQVATAVVAAMKAK